MRAGGRNRKIVIERATAVDGDFGEPVQTWATYTSPFAEVVFGSGAERRDAAQESASAPATFRVLSTALTDAVTVKDRIVFDGSNWDILGNVPSLALNRHREITARRAV